MIQTYAVAAAKKRLKWTTSEFDTELGEYFEQAINRLSPKVLEEAPYQDVAVAVDSNGEVNIDLATLPTPLYDVRDVEESAGAWSPVDNIYRHGTNLRLRDLSMNSTTVRIYGLKEFIVINDSTDVPVPKKFEIAVLWYMMADFYDMLGGSKSKFNIYMQTNGGNAVDDMRTEAEYYEAKAANYIDEKAMLYGA